MPGVKKSLKDTRIKDGSPFFFFTLALPKTDTQTTGQQASVDGGQSCLAPTVEWGQELWDKVLKDYTELQSDSDASVLGPPCKSTV